VPVTPLLAGGRGKLSLIAIVQRADFDAMREQCSGEGYLWQVVHLHGDGFTLPSVLEYGDCEQASCSNPEIAAVNTSCVR